MNIFLFHGENSSAARIEISQMKAGFKGEVAYLDAKSDSSEKILTELQTDSMFAEGEKLIVIENLIGSKFNLELVRSSAFGGQLVFYESKKLTTAQINSLMKVFPGLNVREFKFDPVVFKFLESLFPGNKRLMLKLWQAYSSSEEAEIIFAMIVRQMRLLLLARSSEADGPDDYVNLPPWQKQKIRSQAAKFTPEELAKLIGELSEIDFKVKSGQLSLNLRTALELFLLKI